jgi:hypothetical protein
MEEVPSRVWEYLAGRIRRRIPVLTTDGAKQYFVHGLCPSNALDARHRHYATTDDLEHRRCALCQEPLPPYSDQTRDGNTPPWDLIVYKRYGFGVCNPEGPSHWIYQTFSGLPGIHGVSTGTHNHVAFHATIYDGLHAGFIDHDYVSNLENIYRFKSTMWDRFMLGQWVEAEGLVYPSWKRSVHVYNSRATRHGTGEPVLRPGEGYLFEYIDHGLTAATAVGWVYSERCTCGCAKQNFYLFDEHYEGGKVISYHTAQIKARRLRLEGYPIQATYLDSQAFSRSLMGAPGTPREDSLYSVADEYIDHGISVVPTQKDWKVGYDRISELLLVDPLHVHPLTGDRGAPHLLVADTVGNFIKEIETHKWKIVKNALEPRRDEASDGNDHHMDALNGFLASHPAEVVEFTPAVEEWSLEKDLAQFTPSMSHMAA